MLPHAYLIYLQMYECRSCLVKERHLERFREHLKRAHRSDVTIRCGRCEYEGTKRSDLKRHYRRQHRGKEGEAEDRVFKEASLRYLGRLRRQAGNRMRAQEIARAIGRDRRSTSRSSPIRHGPANRHHTERQPRATQPITHPTPIPQQQASTSRSPDPDSISLHDADIAPHTATAPPPATTSIAPHTATAPPPAQPASPPTATAPPPATTSIVPHTATAPPPATTSIVAHTATAPPPATTSIAPHTSTTPTAPNIPTLQQAPSPDLPPIEVAEESSSDDGIRNSDGSTISEISDDEPEEGGPAANPVNRIRVRLQEQNTEEGMAVTCHVRTPTLGVTRLVCVEVTTESYVTIRGESRLHERKTTKFFPHGELSD